jgi:DNA-directed RNA polymerase subunit H (RpoH/RPB5)
MATSSLVSSVYKGRLNLLKQLEQQGFDIKPYIGFSINEVNSMIRYEQLDMELTSSLNNKKVYVKFYLDKALRPVNINDLTSSLFTIEQKLSQDDHLLIISNNEPNDTLIRTLNDIWQKNKYYVAILTLKRLQFNILEHTLVPKHKVLSDIQVAEIKSTYNILDDSQLPEISRFDPVALAIGLRPGQICHITRNSKTAISADYFRICIA